MTDDDNRGTAYMAVQPIRAYNTLTHKKELFEPYTDDHVRIYTCGVTPYADAHIGHARPALIWSVIRKYLQMRGYRVTLVQNFTDVDDKIIERAAELGEEALPLARRFSDKYMASMRALGIDDADHYPLVSEHIPEIIEMVEALVAKDVAYAADGDVFYDVTRFPDYGDLSGQRLDQLLAGTRFEADERKRNPMDFALWKAAKPGEPAWDSPWGRGRPGWHIECSAMALKYLGNHIDFHGGGLDLVFPHHENEIAQSEAFTDAGPFVRFWVHNGLVNMQAEKMSKSVGNVVSVEALLDEYPAALLRFFLLNTHYRSPLEFSAETLADARRGWQRLNSAAADLDAFLAEADPEGAGTWTPGTGSSADPAAALDGLSERVEGAAATYLSAIAPVWQRFDAAMADDFNTAVALAALFDLVRATNAFRHYVSAQRTGPGADDLKLLRVAQRLLHTLAGELLGVLGDAALGAREDVRGQLIDGLMQLLLDLRATAREQKDWATADAIRDKLQALGIVVEDTAAGARWHIDTEQSGAGGDFDESR